MKTILCLLGLSLSMKSFSQSEYIFYPAGRFTVTVTDVGPYYFTGFQLEYGSIYSVNENDPIFGTVEKTGRYAFKVNSPWPSMGLLSSSLEKYEIFDEQGILIGQVKGTFSENATEPFLFFDKEDRLFAKATLDPSRSQITIFSSNDEVLILSSKTFKYPGFTADPDYFWTIQETPALSFDPRYLWPFVALASELWWREINLGGYD
jgi:hypothetical protein